MFGEHGARHFVAVLSFKSWPHQLKRRAKIGSWIIRTANLRHDAPSTELWTESLSHGRTESAIDKIYHLAKIFPTCSTQKYPRRSIMTRRVRAPGALAEQRGRGLRRGPRFQGLKPGTRPRNRLC